MQLYLMEIKAPVAAFYAFSMLAEAIRSSKTH